MALRGVSSWIGMRCSAARSPIVAVSAPVTARLLCGPNDTDAPAPCRILPSSTCPGDRTRMSRRKRLARSSIEVSAINLPRPMMSTWSTVWAISLIKWLDSSTVRPSEASVRIRSRAQRMPSASSPFTGSSRRTTPGSPSSAAAMPSRCRIPSEKPPMRLCATSCSPTCSSSVMILEEPMRWLRARQASWLNAVRPGCTAPASSSAPTSYSGRLISAYRRPLTRATPDVAS
uniref:FunJ5 n=1 Tax=Streptosporangium sp. KD35 TaxID=2162663 RepID=A0A2U9KD58_9ACTN|nr:FunJ5 [Streptosporangium sp. KD35]